MSVVWMRLSCKSSILTGFAGLVLAVFVLSGCSRGKNDPQADHWVVKIGSVAPLSGPQSHLGADNENGARLAIDDANTQDIRLGGKPVRFELLSEDDAADPRTATIVAQKLVDDGVNGVVGHLNSGTTIPAARIYADEGIPQISPSATNPKYTHQGFPTAFRVMANDEQQGRVLGQFAVHAVHARRIAVIDDATAYGQGLANEFEKSVSRQGARVLLHEHTDDHSTDFSAILTRIKERQPDLVFFGGMDAQSGPMLKQLRELDLNSVFLTGDGGCSKEFHELAGEAAEGSFCSLPGLPLEEMPRGLDFKRRFEARFGDIQDYAPYSYDAVGVLIAAMKKAGSPLPERYLPYLKTLEYPGVTALIRFDANGDLAGGAVTVYRWHQGVRVPVREGATGKDSGIRTEVDGKGAGK